MASHRTDILKALQKKAVTFPACPGVYLFKDRAGVVLYVGKAKNLRQRVRSYFQPGANLPVSRGPEISRMIRQFVADVDYLCCESEVDALLCENRLIKDIQPRFNERLKDDKSFPYVQITIDEDFPRVSITRQPKRRGAKLYGPFVSASELRAALPLMQRVFKFRTCNIELVEGDASRRYFRPCILHNIRQCTAPCAARVSKAIYQRQIKHLRQFLESKASQIKRQLRRQMQVASKALKFEKAAALRDELTALEGLQKRGLVHQDLQPEVFFIEPAEGLTRLAEVVGSTSAVRTIEGIDIAHLGGGESCGGLVCFIDGKPFKSNYRRYKIKTHQRNDDVASLHEVVHRRYKAAGKHEELFPDIILVDGGAGQLSATHSAFEDLDAEPPVLVALAKKEEVIYVQNRSEPIRLPRRDPALRLLQSVRDEAHRFAQHYHHILRRRATLEKKNPVRKRTKPKPRKGSGN